MQDIISKINIPTKAVDPDLIQMILLKYSQSPHDVLWMEVAQILFKHLTKCFEVFDDQLLCATCYFTVWSPGCNGNEEMSWKSLKVDMQITNDCNKPLVISLMYGMFQSSFFHKQWNITYLTEIIDAVFENLMILGFDYAWYTYIVFKTISSFKKLVNTDYEKLFFMSDRLYKLLNLVNNNWENPMTGIRRLNISIFETVFTIFDKNQKQLLIREIDTFDWSKAKYLMLSVIIDIENRDMLPIIKQNDWIDGVIESLFKPGLVSAGTDMYHAILLQLRTEEEWNCLFMAKVMKVLTGNSLKGIEYFTRYWLHQTIVRFPSLVSDFLKELQSEDNKYFFSYLCVMKMGNRLNMLERKWTDKKFSFEILQGLEHDLVENRISAFDIVCFSGSQSSSKDFQYSLVFDYLTNNINSDCTVLRLSMLNNMKLFLQRIHLYWISQIKNKKGIILLKDNVITFYSNVQKLIRNCLNSDGNYQRKVASIKLCDMILDKAHEVVGKHSQPKSNVALIDILNNNEEWYLSDDIFVLKLISLLKDPAVEIRENIVRILLNYYSEVVQEPQCFENIIQNALHCLESKFFFDISCGQKMFELIANVLLKTEASSCDFKNVEDIFIFWYQKLNSEYNLKRSIMDSIETGNQLHSFISVLYVVLDVCLQKQYKLKLSEKYTFPKLLETLEGISNQFELKEEPSTANFDFSQMSFVVQEMIASSGYNPCDVNDESKISGLQQLVLNCLWQNVKACCELLEVIVRYHKNDDYIAVCNKCLRIVTNVLQTSRHKGIIEVAGVSLGAMVRCMTSGSSNQLSRLPQEVLRDLIEVISLPKYMSSVTRRGAGFSIMFHKIVANDVAKGRPSFHYFMSTVLQLCETKDVPDDYETDNSDMNNEKDLPKAIYLHFLTKIVIDSGLSSEIMRYLEQIAKLAFSNLTSEHWQIRNAALQIYGALIPRLVGQKKSCGENEETITTVSSDEFRTHMPRLWTYMLEQLKCHNTQDHIQTHSHLVPILYLLASTAKRYNFSFDDDSCNDYRSLFQALLQLLDSPIYTVRRLSAQAVYNTIPFNMFYEFLESKTCMSENLLHGSLIVTAMYRPERNDHNLKNFTVIEERFNKIMEPNKHSYFSLSIYDSLFHSIHNKHNVLKEINNIFIELYEFGQVPGVHVWADNKLKYLINTNVNPKDLPQIIKLFLGHPNFENHCRFLYENLMIGDSYITAISKDILFDIIKIFLNFDHIYNSSIVWKILYAVSSKIGLSSMHNFKSTYDFLQTNNFSTSFKTRYIIPFTASIAHLVEDCNFVEKFTKNIFSLTEQDFEMRHIAVLANNELGKRLHEFHDNIKINILQTTIFLLQDEDVEIRQLSVNFFKGIRCSPYILLNKVLKRDFLTNTFNNSDVSIPKLIKNVHIALQFYIKHSVDFDENNPFNNDSKNIYIEVKVLENLLDELTTGFQSA